MKYLVILAAIIGLVVYIFLGGPKLAQGDVPDYDRRERVWDRIAALEAQRQDMLIRAKGRIGSPSRPGWPPHRGAYSSGYFAGFDQGYFEGSFLAEGRRPNPLFFTVPNP
ncbi:MAG: hypothetical protein AAGU21_16970 [Solidesulfovibrio sp.]|uniref:hypothetical protein n=1 Tax=Solidesulfovibrio sp. TaxID=2910990 RepID=UPI002B2164A3|nr:hypothetical protein [Solidesulfovibrio sp.]MEA4858099.1 hypothetical protein [Solidesulfovibrio sp.]